MGLVQLVGFVLASQIALFCWYLGLSWLFVAVLGIGLGAVSGLLIYIVHSEFNLFMEDMSRINVEGKCVLVTGIVVMVLVFGITSRVVGCDSGFGLLLAESLVKKGMYVFAAVLSTNSDGAKSLQKHELVKVIQMNVTNETEVDDAFYDINEHLTKTNSSIACGISI